MNREALEQKHEELLRNVSVMSRSTPETFTVTDRLEAIRTELEGTPYQETYDGGLFSLWSKVPIDRLPYNIVLVSSHADVSFGINRCSSRLENGVYKGTYDNAGTNAAAVALMQEYNFPDNVVFAFTGEEETGGCAGAKQVFDFLSEADKEITALALDVTYEGFDDNRLISIENATAPKAVESEFLERLANAMLSAEEEQSFCFVKAEKKHVPSNLPPEYLSPSTGMYDEAFAYRDMGAPACSLCLPCKGGMHSDSGVAVKQPVFEGYVLSVAGLISQLTRSNCINLEECRAIKKELSERAAQTVYAEPKPSYVSSFYPQGYFGSRFPAYDWEEDSYYSDEYDYYSPSYEEQSFGIEETDELSPLIAMLYSEAAMFSPDEEEEFVEGTEIPHEYMKFFCTDPDSAILPEEVELIDEFARQVFREAHGLSPKARTRGWYDEEPNYDDWDYYEEGEDQEEGEDYDRFYSNY